MNLHRSDKVPDWEKVPQEKWNKYQRRAAKTHGIDTPGNRWTMAGKALVGLGLREITKGRKLSGTLLIGTGQLADRYDGKRADETGTKSPLGEALDAGLDKAATAVAVPVLWKNDMIDKRLAVFALAQGAANVALTGIAKKRGKEIHPSWAGKYNAATLWSAVGTHGLAEVAGEYDMPRLEKTLRTAEKVSMAACVILGAIATKGYLKSAFDK